MANSVSVKARKANVRSEPSLSASVIGTVAQGKTLEVIVTVADWIKVTDGSFTGWIHKSLVTSPVPVSSALAAPAAAAPAAPIIAAAPPPAVSIPPGSGEHRPSRRAKKFESSGVAIGVGYGYQHAGFGGTLYAYLQGTGPIKLALYGGAGYFPSFLDHADSGLTLKGSFGWAVGGMILIGGQHRLVLDGSYGLAAAEEGNYSVVGGGSSYSGGYHRTVYGFTGATGYEFMSSDGLFIRPTIGVTRFNEPLYFDGSRYAFTLNLTVGLRF